MSFRSMTLVAKARSQLLSTLTRCGLGGNGDFSWQSRSGSRGELRLALLRAVIASALWPNMAIVAGSEKMQNREGKKSVRLTLHGHDNWGLHCHPSSSVSALTEQDVKDCTVACFQSKMLTSNLFLNNVTLISPLTALLFGGQALAFSAPGGYESMRLPAREDTVCLVQEVHLLHMHA